MQYLFILGEVLLGGYFIMSGVNHFRHTSMLAGYAESKGVPMAKESVLLTGVLLVLGGLGIFLGVYVQISILLLVVFLLVTSFKMHAFWKESDPQAKMGDQINFTKNMALLGALLMLLAIPEPWMISLFW